nr:helix-turn-helix domain-containing protein [Ochrobactrum sp. UNC390CL2Tsu3S39]
MSVQAISWAVTFDAENATEKAVLLILANYADGNGVCFPGQQSIAKQSACSDRSVRRVLDSLEERGIIRRIMRRRGDGTRTSDRIILVAFQQVANLAACEEQEDNLSTSTGHPVKTNRTSCPNQPDTVSRLTTFEPSGNHQQQRADAGKPADDLSILQSKLTASAGDKIQPHGVFDLSAIIGLISAGVDVETDILPTIRARAATMQRPAKGWNYFTDAIKDAHNRRIKAGEGLAKPARIITPDTELAPETLEAEWEKRLRYARRNSNWISAVWGPMPGDDGCRVPSNLLQPTDGKDRYGVRWDDQSKRAA